ncbi:hypothetical protein KI811_08500 [Geobacter hydrogenophilus]|uniref:Uncharacterized protein n=1 Tax=Geobacter hydrogenophilus TaxID=40983 RepID=A0A9W6FZW1_9BACT|nr:hypothetical protein [Geobacter hydrogenophilus]MBT0893850.1 hypothetical protein [Geobacter hydrogenophilus]GLI38209.1 hypothetical protein GHYDROH2_17100 [Geobacter hydrogenophilus]
MKELVKMGIKVIIWIFSAVLFGFPLIVFSVIDWILDKIAGESHDMDLRLGYWKPFERHG